MNNKIELSASKVKRKKKIKKIAKIALLILLLLLIILYIIGRIIYNSGNFTVTLDRNLYYKKNIIIYDDINYKVYRSEIYAEVLESLDNISYKWLPNDLDDHDGGSHNGDNYIAYTFFIENLGDQTSDYWSELIIDDVIKNVDEAVRIRVYKNGEDTTYAKPSKRGGAEENTVPFESDTLVVRDHVENFRPGDIDKYTIIIWIEGNDPECTDNILGGEIKIHMDFKSEFIEK
jgi:hypothetical protein